MRAKFLVEHTEFVDNGYTKYCRVVMNPVVSGSEENKSFSEATPQGCIELHITNLQAVSFFKPRSEYYIDFTEVKDDLSKQCHNHFVSRSGCEAPR